jgi:hypothetical protein
MSDFVDLLCVGGKNDGRRMRVAVRHKRQSLQLVVPGTVSAVMNGNANASISYEIYALTSICGCEVYMHTSLSPHECVRRMLEHYQRLP